MGLPAILRPDGTEVANAVIPGSYGTPFTWMEDRLVGVQVHGIETGDETQMYSPGSVAGGIDFTIRPHFHPETVIASAPGNFSRHLLRAGQVLVAFSALDDNVWWVTFGTDGTVASSVVTEVPGSLSTVDLFVDSNDRPDVEGRELSVGLASIGATGLTTLVPVDPGTEVGQPAYGGMVITPPIAGVG